MAMDIASQDLTEAYCENGATPVRSMRPVDLVYLARITLGDRDLEREVLELFKRQSDIYMSRLANAGDHNDWREAAHTIKGSARGIGAWQVAEFAATIERFEEKDLSAQGKESLSKLAVLVAATNEFIETVLKDR